eukprot:CAMPEP_0198250764 /NCGR_PEP_ID=MMETSP1447-20131203/1820_1 /TAXON_ID=420782 /ORGANISM="Chaetoceros dichaeta, Strain CCMP1751" /LENGTH=142 /DNA_ID=CAMNT_0043935637 /DNA_START=8 /DNA_END=436 /DNA_ORIENTATION=-
MTVFLSLLSTLLWLAVVQANVLSTGEDAKSFIVAKTNGAVVTIFSKSYCPFCKATKATFMELTQELEPAIKFNIEVIELDMQESNDGKLIQDELYEITGQRTVPNVFVSGMPIGGNSDVQRMKEEGSLEKMIRTTKSLAEDL